MIATGFRFNSLGDVRRIHHELLEEYQRSSGEPDGRLLDAIEQFMEDCRAYEVFVESDVDRRSLEGILDYWWVIGYRGGRDHVEAVLANFDPLQAPELDESKCPYLGLDAFGEQTQHVFFGRRQLIEQILDHLRDNRLLVVVGPSGSGKSSLVMGGVVPALRTAFARSNEWLYYAPIVPGADPLGALARMLQPADVTLDEWASAQCEHFRTDPGHLTKLVEATCETPAVVVVDQFEEIFTRCGDDVTRQAFVNNLVHLSQVSTTRHTVIFTLRVDFEIQVARLPELHRVYADARIGIIAPSALELREAIEKPAEMVGLKFQPGVVDALVKEILGEPAGLPLLQFTLHKLWDLRERDRVTFEAYESLGGARLALANSADSFFKQLVPERQATAKRILMRMARPGEGLEVTNNRVRRETLYRSGEASERVDGVLDGLVQARLVRVSRGLTRNDDQFEVAHEALLRNWPKLVEWLDEERVRMRRQLRLTAAAEHWLASARDGDALWRGSQLDEALGFTELNELETEFVRASQTAGEEAELEREASRQRELAQAQLLAEEQRLRAEVESERAELERERAEQQATVWRRLRRLGIVALAAQVVLLMVFLARFMSGDIRFEWAALVAQVVWIVLVLVAAVTSLAAPTARAEPLDRTRGPTATTWRRVRPWWWIVLLTLLTSGFFYYFWLFATWRELKLERADRKMHPFWHALTALVPVYALFRLHAHARAIRDLAASVGAPASPNPMRWALFSLALGVVDEALFLLLHQNWLAIAVTVGGQGVMMLWAQQSLNRIWRAAPNGAPATAIHPIKWGAIILLAMFWILAIIGLRPVESTMSAQSISTADVLLRQAQSNARAGNRVLAEQQYAQAVSAAQRVSDGRLNNQICWYGSLDGFAAVVMPACERAVQLATQAGDTYDLARHRDSRGLARALTGDSSGAIQDFNAYVTEAQSDNSLQGAAASRQKWIEDLQQNQNPFDKATIDSLRSP